MMGMMAVNKTASRVTCYNCGKEGHISRNCVAPRKTTAKDEKVGVKRTVVCYRCNEPGHISRECQKVLDKENRKGLTDCAPPSSRT